MVRRAYGDGHQEDRHPVQQVRSMRKRETVKLVGQVSGEFARRVKHC